MLLITVLLLCCFPLIPSFFFFKVAEPAHLSKTCKTALFTVNNFGKGKRFSSVVSLVTCWKVHLNVTAWRMVFGQESSPHAFNLVILISINKFNLAFHWINPKAKNNGVLYSAEVKTLQWHVPKRLFSAVWVSAKLRVGHFECFGADIIKTGHFAAKEKFRSRYEPLTLSLRLSEFFFQQLH